MPEMSHAYLLGLFFIALVCIIWSASSLLTQYIYTERSFHSPFLLTYIGVSLFSLWLPVWYARHAHTALDPDGIDELPTIPSEEEPPVAGRRRRHNDGTEQQEDGASDSPYFRSSPPPSYEGVPLHSGAVAHRKWGQSDHFYAAVRIAPVWFLANWCYNSSLAYTSITSSTVLASTGSVFTFLFAVCSGDERFGWIKLIGVLLGVSGSIATAFTDVSNAESDDALTPSSSSQASEGCEGDDCFEKPLFGDFLGLMSAIGYGVYAVQTRLYCPHDESLYSMQLLLGYIGLICMVGLSPIALWKWTGVDMSLEVFGFLALKGLFDNVLSDYLWLRAVILTSATVATVGLGLTIPLAFMSDLWQGAEDVITFGSVSGALLVLFGFVLVNHGTEDEHANDNLHNSDRPRESQELSDLSPESLRPLNSWDDDETEEDEEGAGVDCPNVEHVSPQA